MDFQKQLLEIGKALEKDEVKALAFLCIDFLGRSLNSVESANDLFRRLADQDYLSSTRLHLLTELLLTIQRTRLVREFNLPDRESVNSGFISPYRKLLYNLSEELSDDDLKHVKFLLRNTLPRRKLEQNVTILDVFIEMEHMDILSHTNLNELETIIEAVCPVLKEKINQYKELPEHQQMTSVTFASETPQMSQSVVLPSCGARAFRSVAQSSFDSPEDVQTHYREPECLPMQVNSFEPSCSTNQSANDAVAIQGQESETVFEFQTFQTTLNRIEGLRNYPMTAKKRGICLIINNYDFSKTTLKTREGTNIDERALRDVFKWLGFEVETKIDCTASQMLSALRELGRRNHAKMDCVACCILSHGIEGGVIGVDDETVMIKDLMEPLNGLNCPSLAEKPKMFFIQACQGTDQQWPVFIESDSPTSSDICTDAVEMTGSIPSDSDFLQAMSTVPSCVSFRERSGTWFIQSLCQNLVQMVPREFDLVSILTKVNADVSQKTATGRHHMKKKQMPQPAFTLTKKLVFPVPTTPPPRLSDV